MLIWILVHGSSELLGQPTTRTDLIDYRPDCCGKDSKAELAGLVAGVGGYEVFRLVQRGDFIPKAYQRGIRRPAFCARGQEANPDKTNGSIRCSNHRSAQNQAVEKRGARIGRPMRARKRFWRRVS